MRIGDFIAIACAAITIGVVVFAFAMERRERRTFERRKHRRAMWP